MSRWQTIVSFILVAIAAGFVVFWPSKKSSAPTVHNTNQGVTNSVKNTNTGSNRLGSVLAFSTVDLQDRDPNFVFQLNLPTSWRAQSQAGTKSIVFYDPAVKGSVTQQAMIWVTYYTGSAFGSPTGLDGHVLTATSLDHHPMRRYSLTAATTTSPSGFPTWWSDARTVVEVQGGTAKPYLYTVFNFSPILTSAEIDQFASSIQLGPIVQPE